MANGFTVPISRLVLGAQTDEAYKWLQSPAFTTGLLVLVCQQTDQPIQVSKGRKLVLPNDLQFHNHKDYFSNVWDDIFVLDCDPVLSGHLTVKTEIVVVQSNRPTFNDPRTNGQKVECVSATCMSDFLSKASDPRGILPKQSGSSLNLNLKEITNVQFKCVDVVVVPNEDILSRDVANCEGCIHDADNSVVMGKRTAQELGLFQGSFIDIKINTCGPKNVQKSSSSGTVQNEHKFGTNTSESTCSTKASRVAQVCVVQRQETESLKNTVFINSCLWFHLSCYRNLTQHKKSCCIRKHTWTISPGLSSSRSWSAGPAFAQELHVSCVLSPNYSMSSSYSNALQHYFSSPRLIQKGDILCVRTSEDGEFHQDMTDSFTCRTPLVYFKVMKILPKVKGHPAFLADVNHTTLLQEGTVNSYIPSAMSLRPTSRQLAVCLDEYTTKLINIIKPYIASRDMCEDVCPSVLLTGAAGSGKTCVSNSVAARLTLHLFKVNCHELCGETSAATETRIKHIFQKAVMYAPCLVLLLNINALGKDRDGHSEDPRVASVFHEHIRNLSSNSPKLPVVVIATASSPQQLTSDMHEGFLHVVEMGVPNESLRKKTLEALLASDGCSSDVNLKHIAQRTAGMVHGDLHALVMRARVNAHRRVSAFCGSSKMSMCDELSLCHSGVTLHLADFISALDTMQASHSDAIGAPKIPSVQWEDVGGLMDVKRDILDTIQLPLQHPELMAAGLRRSGVLLYGPPGTGKTLLAKAVATECSLNFLSVKGPELLNMYVGQSEENVREVFSKARSATPCVIFFDELDSLAPNRGRSGDSGGVMDRVVSQLLAELDGLHKATDVFIIGATNRPDLLDPALLRPGRFDKLLHLGVSEDKNAQLKILKALTRKFHLAEGTLLENVAQRCPPNLTGADLYALCSDALLCAMKQKVEQLDSGDAVTEERVEVNEEHFITAISSLVPSVSIQELVHYKSLQQSFMQTQK